MEVKPLVFFLGRLFRWPCSSYIVNPHNTHSGEYPYKFSCHFKLNTYNSAFSAFCETISLSMLSCSLSSMCTITVSTAVRSWVTNRLFDRWWDKSWAYLQGRPLKVTDREKSPTCAFLPCYFMQCSSIGIFFDNEEGISLCKACL